MNRISVHKDIIMDLPMSYAIQFLSRQGERWGVCASEGTGGCFAFPLDDIQKKETVWENAGGTMSISQIDADGAFLAVQNFFKGFNAKTGCLVKAVPGEAGWQMDRFMDMPYLHRFDVVEVEGRQFLIACTLCRHKEFRLDWSHPGQVTIGELTEGRNPPAHWDVLIPSLTKNHGFYRGTHRGREVILIAGMEGLYEVSVPSKADGPWDCKKLIEREISDACIVDLDNDGVEEIVTIEGFHGDHIAVNKLVDGQWQIVYSYPAPFAHVVWGGDVLGKKSLILAYRNDNGALMLLQKADREDAFSMEHIVIDELISPTNLVVDTREKECVIYVSCGKTQQVARYILRAEA